MISSLHRNENRLVSRFASRTKSKIRAIGQSTSKVAFRSVALSFAISFLAVGVSTDAAVVNASSPLLSAVQSAVNSASPGDTVQVPAGSATWTSTLTISKDIQLIGAGIDQTIIIDEISRAASPTLVSWTTTSSNFDRLSGFTFHGGVTNTVLAYNGSLSISGTCKAFRLDTCKFSQLYNDNVVFGGWVYGVVDHCLFWNSTSIGIEDEMNGYDGDSYGDGSWSDADSWGTTNALYVESCSFTNNFNPGTGAIDALSGARFVFRYNRVTNCIVNTHGTESGQRFRSSRYCEVYENTIVWQTPTVNSLVPMAVNLRGGTCVMFSNNLSGGIEYPIMLSNYRDFPNKFVPWANGTSDNVTGANLWDSNSATIYAGGTATAGSGTYLLNDSTKSWTVNQWKGYTLWDVTQQVGADIQANTATSLTVQSQNPYGANLAVNNGDTYQIRYVDAGIDQCGFGQGHLLADTSQGNGIPYDTVTGTTNWPQEASDPVYDWGNTLVITLPDNPTGNYAVAQNNVIKAGRDWFDGIPKPGYAPLVYPHPLVSGAPAPTSYTLTVVNGNGSGNYNSNSVVSISATTIADEIFENWSGLDVANTNSANTTVTMPAANLTVTANFATNPPPSYTLTVVNGTGSGHYNSGVAVSISAILNLPENGVFTNWSGLYIANTNSANTTVSMPASNLTVTPNYVPYPPSNLTVVPKP